MNTVSPIIEEKHVTAELPLPFYLISTNSLDDQLKQVLDIVAVSISLLMLWPLLLLLAFIVRLDSPGPIIHRRRVVGENGTEFDAFKFRSMVTNGDEVLAQHPELLKQWQKDVKLKEDPRVTGCGAWMRKYSLDELPQLLNVLRGEMSIVGPRMISPAELDRFGEYADERMSVKPGITGLWQVSGRSDLDHEKKLVLDIQYVRTRNIWLDARLILLTIPVALRGGGAY